jgi:hypothetical protein
MSNLLQENSALHQKYRDVEIRIPRTLVITTQGFKDFVELNGMKDLSSGEHSDQDITQAFLGAKLPADLDHKLLLFLEGVHYPLSVRSSSLLEDAQFQPFAGLYRTYMIPNNDSDLTIRHAQLTNAVKRVFASTYYKEPLTYARVTSSQYNEEAMAVIIQELTGKKEGDFFYPDISGVCQSRNFYPVSKMEAEDGIAHIALGLGRTVVEGEKCLRFCPKYPEMLPQFSTVDEILENAQRRFYALRIKDYPESLNFEQDGNLEKRNVDEAENEMAVQRLSGTYDAAEHRIRNSSSVPGSKVLTFASVLRSDAFPLPQVLADLMEIGQNSMGCPVEIEFSVRLNSEQGASKGIFYFLQMRPMAGADDRLKVNITKAERKSAVLHSHQALGNGKDDTITEIVYVKPEAFKKEATIDIAKDIGKFNSILSQANQRYLLIGPGRWGTADRWLGIPVQWHQISGVGMIVELRNKQLSVDSSQGSHFFQNITALGIPYVTVTEGSKDRCNWDYLEGLFAVNETKYLRHVRCEQPLVIKISSNDSECVIVER